MKTYYLLRIASFLVRFVPPRLAYWLCSIIGGIIFLLNYEIRDAVLDNMGHVLPKASRRLRRVLARRIIRNVVKNYYDVIRLPTMTPDSLERTITVHGIGHLDKALAVGKGVIIISGHIGNFNIVAQLAAARGYKVSVVAEDIEPPKLYDYVNRLRGHFGLKMIKLGSSEVRTIYRLLKNNEALMLAVDRNVTDEDVPTVFFGEYAAMPHGAVALALRTGAALVPGYTVRLPDNTSVVIIDPPLELERTGERDLDVRVNMRKVANTLEKYIIEAPHQWVILQRVWDKQYTDVGDEGRKTEDEEATPSEVKGQAGRPTTDLLSPSGIMSITESDDPHRLPHAERTEESQPVSSKQ
jgi:lauroyl/myristoyl acyltransferase